MDNCSMFGIGQTTTASPKPTRIIDWEQRRYEIAKDMLYIAYCDDNESYEKAAHNAVKLADALINELNK